MRAQEKLREALIPGKSGESVLAHRITSTGPGVAMPAQDKHFDDKEGLAAARQWIVEIAKWLDYRASVSPRQSCG